MEIISAVPTEIAPSDLAQIMATETERRALITGYIAKHMKEGVDYGTIKIGGRDSKPSLFKPGSEKFLSLFKLTATFKKDSETFEMAGSPNGLFCYVCEIKTSKGVVVGEGRGVAALSEKSWTINSCVKIAQKRAQVDAVLRMGALSDFFTQDLEDMFPAQKYDSTPIPARAVPTVSTTDHELEYMETDSPEEYDSPEEAPAKRIIAEPKVAPWKNPKSPDFMTKTEQKKKIFELCNSKAIAPLVTKEEYQHYVLENTGLNLAEVNYANIIRKLEEL